MIRSFNLLSVAILLPCLWISGVSMAVAQESLNGSLVIPQILPTSSLTDDLQLSPSDRPISQSIVGELEPGEFLVTETYGSEFPGEGELIFLDGTGENSVENDEGETDDKSVVVFGDWLGYNSVKDDTTWLFGRGDDFGMFSLKSFPTLDLSDTSALVTGIGIHFLNGPIRTDMPPRLYDFLMGYHTRLPVNDRLMLDLKAGVGIFSDFEGSAREGVRGQGHAVSYFEWHPWLVSVAGVEVLDRDDYSVLPVGGFVVRPNDNMIFDLIFPRPKATFRTGEDHAVYVSGELGGNTWAIERSSGEDDVVTYKDLRVLFGAMKFGKTTDTAFEFGWAFDRELSYRSGSGDYSPNEAFLIQLRANY